MKKIPFLILASMAIIFAFSGSILPIDKNFCTTRYPIVLVHGLGFRDDLRVMKYWGKIVDRLKSSGAVIILGNQQAFSSHEGNAKMIKASILKFLKDNPAYDRVNIIAHSKGGIESRYMIKHLHMESMVASLTTLATPHRGSKIADILMNTIPSDRNTVVRMINGIAKLIGDPVPDAFDAGYELTSDYMEKFNSIVTDSKKIMYQSYACTIDGDYPNLIWKKLWKTLWELDGPNDGLVTVRSAKWGEFKGIVRQDGKNTVSHADIIGMHQLTGVYDFNEESFFIQLVHDLKNRGF